MSYRESIERLVQELPIKEGTFLITGATGLIGTCIINTLVAANEKGCSFVIYALGRSKKKMVNKFGDTIIAIEQDICASLDDSVKYDYIIHCASNADPLSYANQPAETILTNVLGSKNVLDYCKNNVKTRLLLTSSFEVYGWL